LEDEIEEVSAGDSSKSVGCSRTRNFPENYTEASSIAAWKGTGNKRSILKATTKGVWNWRGGMF